MKKYEQYAKWVVAFLFGVALIGVYKTFDNIQNVFSFFGDVFSAAMPFVIGFVIAYIFNLPCKKLEAVYGRCKWSFIKKRSRGLSILSVYTIFVIIFALTVSTLIPKLYNNIVDLYNNVIPFTQKALDNIEAFQKNLGINFIEINSDTVKEGIQKLLNSINVKEFGKYAQGAISITSGIMEIFIALIISVYMLVDREHLRKCYRRAIKILLPEKKAANFHKYMVRVNRIFSNYVYCCVLDAVIIAILATIILSILGVKYAFILGTMIGLFNLIPYFGAIISNFMTIIITIFTSGWLKAVWTAVSLVILAQIDGNFIGPKIMGEKLDARPLWIIFAVTLGGGLFGVAGMILSVPVMMVVKMIVIEELRNIEERKSSQEKF